ncbi:uncharacterized protein E0L32_008374 [Thyridium curvatum]|uniref:Uncharacterized protein n=1 Tax=Thyridium curvatum TaxID=1093900 RepID=A0A507B264_9PEZI|nr:uncharacterized protein E0L32_008374 [Thyridium curvatum]TPX10640.1 hypothetical protein E0L32_008374 [Thyridium curvatum]
MLLTSSQVSVAVSCGVVVCCTVALFLSGYFIQQRTLRTLRAAIREPPKPSPKIFLPDRFKIQTTELPDGTIIVLDGNSNNDGEDLFAGAQAAAAQQEPQQQQQKEQVLVEVKQSVPELRKKDEGAEEEVLRGEATAAQQEAQEKLRKIEAEEREAREADAGKARQKTTTTTTAKAAQKKKKKKKQKQASKGDGKDGSEEEKPISSAERRRRIREEIRKLAEGDKPIYYQRRLY